MESVIESVGFSTYSPQRDCSVVLHANSPMEDRNLVYDENVIAMEECNIVVAYIDDFDPGTIWEMGFAQARGKHILTYSRRGFDLNLMLSQLKTILHILIMRNANFAANVS